ncbi:MAG: exodeoxyribonuclease VII large subunit [Phycisphaerales bacterium]|nr:exodeoxyribonuclease VII large subunit [Phycisphaerales bacterium]
MAKAPFDPMKTASMRTAREKKAALFNPDTPPLPPEEERALIEATALANEIRHEDALLLGGTADHPLSVKSVNSLINQTLAATLPPQFFIAGELSNFRTYDRGHAFFTLKETGAELPCVLWKDGLARLKFRPKDGLAVIACGNIKLYEPQGKLQLYVETLFPQGAGALELAFRQLCEKLKAEGLFDPARKRPIPRLPQRIVIITSRTGDVLHDVLTTAYRRFPGLHTMLFPVRVQGDQSADDIIHAIQLLNKNNNKLQPDLILLVRGGGSLEDLWPFNDERLAHAIVASTIPIATGIGHEPDTTIADLVGDLRGPTPTAITELTIPDVRVLLQDLRAKSAILTRDLRRTVELAKAALDRQRLELTAAARQNATRSHQQIEQLCKQIERIEPRHAIAQGWRRVEESQRKLTQVPLQIARCRDRLASLETHLRVVSPQSVLERGFSITTDANGTVVRSADQVKKGDLLTTRLRDGNIISTVGKPKQASLF